ncbi:MAG: PilZ domain-containing protein [Sandaracinaceae bacterium]|nr:MAG: PilZ domain-containing protein [Sandaracinaceae bacterium]
MFELVRPHRRRSARRAYRSRCQAVRLEDFRLVGERILDLSPKGALVAFDDEVHVGEEILLDFRAPWLGPFVSVSGRVTRVVHGWREGDPGYAAALAFEHFDPEARRVLRERLVTFPTTRPQRRAPVDYAETVRRIGSREPASPAPLTFMRRAIVLGP